MHKRPVTAGRFLVSGAYLLHLSSFTDLKFF